MSSQPLLKDLPNTATPPPAKHIESVLGDKREVTLEHADEEFVATLGELAQEALDELKKG